MCWWRFVLELDHHKHHPFHTTEEGYRSTKDFADASASMQVAKLESCHNCQRLTSMVSNGPHVGKKAEKNRKALEAWKKTEVGMTEDVTM